jgi:hypothetical protein
MLENKGTKLIERLVTTQPSTRRPLPKHLAIRLHRPENKVLGVATGYSLQDPGIESAPFQTGFESHPASYKMGSGVLSRWYIDRGMALTTHRHLTRKLTKVYSNISTPSPLLYGKCQVEIYRCENLKSRNYRQKKMSYQIYVSLSSLSLQGFVFFSHVVSSSASLDLPLPDISRWTWISSSVEVSRCRILYLFLSFIYLFSLPSPCSEQHTTSFDKPSSSSCPA